MGRMSGVAWMVAWTMMASWPARSSASEPKQTAPVEPTTAAAPPATPTADPTVVASASEPDRTPRARPVDVGTSPAVVGCTDGGECAMLGHGLMRVRVELLDVSDATLGDPED